MFGDAGVVVEILDGLIARPTFGVNAGVHDETHGAPHFVGELPKLLVGIGVKTELRAHRFAIKRPTFDVRRIFNLRAKIRQAFHFRLKRKLQMMARHGFVQRERFHLPSRTMRQIVSIDVKPAGPSGLR